MGPRLISRGVPQTTSSLRHVDAASMGPRLISRGVWLVSDTLLKVIRLQWGRGSLAAAWVDYSNQQEETPCFNGAAAH